jgi:D-sedoheptulose 7-phosphate isomerase
MKSIDLWVVKKQEELKSLGILLNNFDFDQVRNLGDLIIKKLNSGNKIAFLGNGGSAAEAMHIASEFVSKCCVDHKPLHVICLNESQSAITAIGNDYGFESIFERLVRSELKNNDVLVALSTSGKSANILNAIKSALELGVHVVLWTGSKNIDLPDVEIWNCPIISTPRIQEVHLVWGHLIAEYVECHFPNE